MKTKHLSFSATLLAAGLVVAACGKTTRHDTSQSASEPHGSSEVTPAERPTERAGSDTGNTGHGRGRDASSAPITGMSGSATGSGDKEAKQSETAK